MATRTRGQRRNNPSPEATTSLQYPTAQQYTPRSAASKASRYGSLSKDPIPRRSAPRPPKADSVVSLGSRVRPNSEIDEDEAQEDAEEESQERQTPGPDNEELYQIMLSLLPDFTRAVDELHHRLVNGDRENIVFATILNSKRTAFYSLLKYYQKPQSDLPFIDPERVAGLSQHTEVDLSNVLLRANIVNAVDGIQQLNHQTTKDAVSFLSDLDSAFSHLFTSEAAGETHQKLALDLRTCFAIEVLAADPGKFNIRDIIASAFCKDADTQDYARLFANGPFKRLTDDSEDEVGDDEAELISERVAYLYGHLHKDKNGDSLQRMRNKYSLDQTLQKLQQCLFEWYILLKDADRNDKAGSNGLPETGRESWHDAEETIPDSISESQPIMRPTDQEKRGASLFRGAKSFRELQSTSPRRTQRPPPSNQQQHRKAPSIAPSDYSQHDTRDLLLGDIIRSPAQRGGRKRTHQEVHRDDDDDEDEFENDTRQVPDYRRAQVNALSAAQAAKRPRLSHPQPSQQMPPPPVPNRASSSPKSTPDFAALRERKAEIATWRRALHASSQTPPSAASTSYAVASGPKQRHPWSNHDSFCLIELISEVGAKWSIIEQKHSKKFERERDQQAYRDKARNLKVDFLMTDTVLPPGFDKVALASNQIRKLQALGKNPRRLEADMDADGNAINTDL